MFKPEEIQERLAEFENRISFLENSLPGSAMTPKEEEREEIPEKPWNKNQWSIVQQLKGEMLNLKGKFLELEGKSPRSGKRRYKQYSI